MDAKRKANTKLNTRVQAVDSNPPPIGSKIYAKNSNSFSSSNGAVANGNAVRNGKPLLRQNSFINGGPVPAVLTVVVDPDKLEAAKKRREEEKEKEQQAQVEKPKPTWKQRLKWLVTMLLSLTMCLSGFSLLFIIPLAVDPILHGFEAQFSAEPVICRTTSSRFAYGTVQCDTPSCREGCTADIYNCTFIYVTYSRDRPWRRSASSFSSTPAGRGAVVVAANANVPFRNSSDTSILVSNSNHFNHTSYLFDNNEIDSADSNSDLNEDNLTFSNATLFVTPTGCGYPPEINCSVFDELYMQPGSVYPCHYSQTDDSLVVPYYNWNEEFLWLSFILGFPLSSLVTASILLFVVLKWKVDPPPSEQEAFSDVAGGAHKTSANGGPPFKGSTKDKWAQHYNHNHHHNAHDSTKDKAEHVIETWKGATTDGKTEENPSTSGSVKANGHGPPKAAEVPVQEPDPTPQVAPSPAPEPTPMPASEPPPAEPGPSKPRPYPYTPNVIPIAVIAQSSSFTSSTDSAIT